MKASGPMRLKLKYCKLLSSFAFKFNLRRYTPAGARSSPGTARAAAAFIAAAAARQPMVGRCTLTLSNPM